jgi:peptidoglycan-associated lipoprotein
MRELGANKGACMMICQSAVVLVALLMAITFGGCATQTASEPSAIAGVKATLLSGRDADSAGLQAGTPAVQPGNAARPRLGDFAENAEIRDIHFDFDSYEIGLDEAKILDTSLVWLRKHPDALLAIEGHTDERGTNEYNVALGDRRAKASKNYLVSHGIQSSRITIISYGEERGLCQQKTEPCWKQNRRAHFLVKMR